MLINIDCDEIIQDRLWVGVYVTPEDAATLKLMGITSIVDLQSDEDLQQYSIPIEELSVLLSKMGIELRRVPVQDFSRQDLIKHLPRCVEEIESALSPPHARVYVHCTAGINRSPAAAAAYLIKSRGLSVRQAYEYVVGRRQCSPYLDVLEQYASLLRGGCS